MALITLPSMHLFILLCSGILFGMRNFLTSYALII